MARRGAAKPRSVNPDPIYGSELVTKLINRAMRDGKKSVTEKQIYRAFELVEKEAGEGALAVFNRAMENIKPTMEVRPRRIGGAAYQVPMPVRGGRRESLAIRWLITYARERGEKDMSDKLASEIIAASNNEGNAIKKREDNLIAEAAAYEASAIAVLESELSNFHGDGTVDPVQVQNNAIFSACGGVESLL